MLTSFINISMRQDPPPNPPPAAPRLMRYAKLMTRIPTRNFTPRLFCLIRDKATSPHIINAVLYTTFENQPFEHLLNSHDDDSPREIFI